MLSITPARLRGRNRRALLAAAFPAALVAMALPGAAEAATVEIIGKTQTTLVYEAAGGEVNDVKVFKLAEGVVISDSVPIRLQDEGVRDCRLTPVGDAFCSDARNVIIRLGDRNDRIQRFSPAGGRVEGGSGNDVFVGGAVLGPNDVMEYSGGEGEADKVTYASSSVPVSVSLDGLPNDGHGGDRADVRPDVEIVEGSAFDDTLTGSDAADKRERYFGGAGNDRITGLGGSDVFHEGSAPNGADTFNGGAGLDLVDYSQRTQRVDVRMDDLARNDGEAGENDFIDPNTNDAFGGSGGDHIEGGAGANVFIGNGGDDALVGNGGNDRVNGGSGSDFLSGGANDDIVESVDNAPDTIRCGGELDTLTRDLQDVDATGCETVNSVGTLALTPKALAVEAGKTARLRLSWTHPQSWRKLRKVTLRLRQREQVVGRVTVRPRSERIFDAGAVELVRRATRLTHKGQTLTARLALRLDESLAGKTLKADVQATDTRGRRQLVRDAGSIRVAR